MNKSYVYSETAFHHEGDIGYLKKLIDVSVVSGVQGIKFQILTKANDFVSRKHENYHLLKSYCFNIEEWREIFGYAQSKGLDIVMMPLNIEACKLIEEFRVKYVEIHSVSFNDIDLLNEIIKYKVGVIIGVGGRELTEIYKLKDFFKKQLKVLMVGFQSFPSKLEDVRLAKIQQLKNLFPELKIGYADHSSFESDYSILSNDYARLLGATIFEKHITLNEGVKRVDFESAVGEEKMKEIVDRLIFIDNHVLNNDHLFLLNEKELVYRNRQLICVASRDLDKGTIIKKEDILLKMITIDNSKNACVDKNVLIGKKIGHLVKKDEAFILNNIYDL